MYKQYYFMLLALKGYSLLAISNNFIVSKKGSYYVFWYFSKPYKKLINIGTCHTRGSALFRWKILMKEVI